MVLPKITPPRTAAEALALARKAGFGAACAFKIRYRCAVLQDKICTKFATWNTSRSPWGKFMGMYIFLREWVRSPRAIGMVCPSGSALARSLASLVPQEGNGLVIELGAGTGTVTQELLRCGISPQRLLVIERAEGMVELLRVRFPGIRVLQADAAQLSTYLPANSTVDCIVSSLPLVSLPVAVRDAIIREFHALLGCGVLLQYTYSWSRGYILFQEGFQCVLSRRVWFNMPPARVMSLVNHEPTK